MKVKFCIIFTLLNLMISTFAQRNASLSNIQPINKSTDIPDIIINKNNPAFPVEILGSVYDPTMNNLPVWTKSFSTQLNEEAQATIKPLSVRHLKSDEAVAVKKYFSNYLSADFHIKYFTSYSGNSKIWTAYIIPFRMKSDGTIEFLKQFEIEWTKWSSNKSNPVSVQSFTNQSVLASGQWYKIGIKNTGIYKIDKAFLQSMGIDVSQIDPRNIRIYGNGGDMVNPKNNKFRYDDLQENAIFVYGENDGVFDDNDYILFYGKGSDSWIHRKNFPYSNPYNCLDYYHYLHRYSDSAYYFLNFDMGPGLRITNYFLKTVSTYTSNSYDYLNYHEIDVINFLKSGPDFYGEYFDLQTSYSFPYTDGNFVTGDTIKAFISLAARSDYVSNYTWSVGGSTGTFTAGQVQTGNYLADFAAVSNQCFIVPNNSTSNTITFNITKNSSNAVAWLDKIVFNARRYLVFNNKAFEFSDKRNVAPNQITTYSISVLNPTGIQIWDITNPLRPFNQQYDAYSNYILFQAPSDTLHRYIIFTLNDAQKPKFIKQVNNQNLHAIIQADYIIVTHPQFKQQALELAQLHQQEEGLTYAVVTTEEVYNEFSSGNPDATAIREFARMLYKRSDSLNPKPRYLLLFGDGTFNNKDRSSNTSALIPTYQTGISVSPILSTVTDDFYGWLDDNEGDDWANSLVDIGVGRFTVSSIAQAINVVNKVKAYYKKNLNFTVQTSDNCCKLATNNYPQGDWRTILTFLADDGDSQLHMWQADSLMRQLNRKHPEYNLNKIMADAYQQITVPGGNRFPDASAALDRAFEKGSLVINYTGHGNEVGLGHEAFLTLSQINNYKNINNMPLFITATCEFTRFDDPDRLSAGEQCFLQPNGCAIAMFTTVRLAYASTNFYLSQKLFDEIIDTLPNGEYMALGDIVKTTKQKTNIGFYFLNFHLIGDPALKLAYPKRKIIVTSINNHTISSSPQDTLKALSKVTVSGFIADKNGNKLTNFNGIIYPTVFDKPQVITGLGNKPESIVSGKTFTFVAQKNILFKGKVEVKNGDFTFSFIVPKDINYAIDTSKMSFYAHNGIEDAVGYTTKFYIGGSNPNAIADNQPPQVDLFLNDKKFVSGGITNPNPVLFSEIVDSSGINISGNGIGHDIVVTLDNTKQINLNDYFEYDLNSYQKGKIKYPFSGLSEGNHQLSLKVWDVNNNSNTVKLDFVVANSEELALDHVLNYPNPFTTKTKFMFEYNTSCEQIKVKVEIFTISGKLVKTIHKDIYVTGYREDSIEWDGRDDYGDKLARGVYIYKVTISDTNNKKAEKIEKLVILN
ncbi:MAG: peptidase C25 [Bacteroidia bacterium]|nr:MAG: peptidase C25 [Bacteroidia bacterium]